MGGGVIGCETALYLARRGKQVSISTRRTSGSLAEDLYDHNNHDYLLFMLEAADIDVHYDTIPERLDDDGVVATSGGRVKKIPADCLVFSGRMLPDNSLSKSLANTGTVFSVGDCVEPARIMEAVWGAFKTVREIEA